MEKVGEGLGAAESPKPPGKANWGQGPSAIHRIPVYNLWAGWTEEAWLEVLFKQLEISD